MLDPGTLEALLPLLLPWAIGIALALARVGGFALGLPNMTAPGIPRQVQVLAALALAFGLAASHLPRTLEGFSPLSFAVEIGLEFMAGLALGFLVQLGAATARFAGQIAGVEMGLSFAAVADPTSPEQSTAISILLHQMGVMLFLALGLDRFAVRALAANIDAHPLGRAHVPSRMPLEIVGLLDGLIEKGLSLALPLVGAVFCLKLSMAMLARVAPKLQIFSLSFALTITVGVGMLAVSLPSMVPALTDHLRSWMQLVWTFAVA